MAIIDKIQLSGTVYTIGNETTTAVTSASTDNEIPTAKAVYDAIPQGGGGSSINVVQTTGTSTADVMSQDAVTTQFSNKLDSVDCRKQYWAGSGITSIDTSNDSKNYTTITFAGSINNKPILTGYDYTKVNKFSLVETSAITTSVTSASTDNEIPTAKAVYDAIPQGGGGKAISGGTNISITTGETADTINCTLPITVQNSSIIIKNGSNSASYDNNFSQVFGSGNTIDGYGGYSQPCITVEGIGNTCGTKATHVEGGYNIGVYGSYSHVEGAHNKLTVSTSPNVEVCSHVEGKYNKVLNYSEHASGQYNNSVSASTTFGDSGNTLFSVGNGTADNARHNAFEIRQNGDIYISKDGQDVKLQDQLGGGGSITIDTSLDSGSTNPVANSAITNAINSKENHLTYYLKTWQIKKKYSHGCNALYFTYRYNDNEVTGWFPFANINGISVESENNFSLVETSAITTSVTSESTDAQVPSAKAVYDMVGNINTILETI